MSIELKTAGEIATMRKASRVVAQVLTALRQLVRPGVTTRELDTRARELTKELGASSAFLGYPAHTPNTEPFPGVICASRNEEIVHGIPNDVPLKEGDIISIDYGCSVEGFFGDSAITVPVGEVSPRIQQLLEVTARSLEAAIVECRAGKRIGDISFAVQSLVEKHGFGVVREFVGHGIGRKMHEQPAVPNFGAPGQGRVLKPGMVLAIEPMVTAGGFETKVLSDGWTAVTKDGSFAAHFEHTVAITDGEPDVLTRP
jgi:methionyl aminopeptidase